MKFNPQPGVRIADATRRPGV